MAHMLGRYAVSLAVNKIINFVHLAHVLNWVHSHTNHMKTKVATMPNYAPSGMNLLYTPQRERKYINTFERNCFIKAAKESHPLTKTLCLTLMYTGCRISEALASTGTAVQPETGVMSFFTLKQRRKQLVVREIPIPEVLVAVIDEVHHLRQLQSNMHTASKTLLWPWSRTWAWMQIKAVMTEAGITGPQATCKGLRHGFCIHALLHDIPVTTVKKWAGHAHLSTTEIYTQLLGAEERMVAKRMW